MYNYQTERVEIFTDDGQRLFIKIRDNVQRLLAEAGAVRMDKAIAGFAGAAWTMLACVDRLVELGEIVEVTPANAPGRDRVFVAKPNHYDR